MGKEVFEKSVIEAGVHNIGFEQCGGGVRITTREEKTQSGGRATLVGECSFPLLRLSLEVH